MWTITKILIINILYRLQNYNAMHFIVCINYSEFNFNIKKY